MRRPASTLLLIAATAALAACNSAPAPPPTPIAPTVADVPEIDGVPERVAPPSEDLTTTISYPSVSTDPQRLADGVTIRPNYKVPAEATIVISVPAEEQVREGRRQESELGSNPDSEGVTSFKTTGYFNKAEQQIVRSLLGKGFTVVERAKFEAKLRDQRTGLESRDTAAKKAELEVLNEQKDSGAITVDEWAAQIARIEKKYDPQGRRGGAKNELFDNSELIRAAQSGEVQADFILQVNTFKTDAISDRTLYVTDDPGVSALCSKHPGLRRAIENAGATVITRPGFYGHLNADLFDVQTGAYVWVGEHRVDSLNVLSGGFRVTLPITRRASNVAELNRAIRAYNDDVGERRARALELKRLIEEGEFLPEYVEGQPFDYTEQSSKVDEYKAMVAELDSIANSSGPAAAQAEFDFEYVVEPMEMRPNLPTSKQLLAVESRVRLADSTEERAIAMQEYLRLEEFLGDHYTRLAQLVSKELISTIPSE